LSDELGRKRHDGDTQQQQPIQQHEYAVDPDDVLEHPVMVDPHDQDE
jgi:hypothetical protein